MAKRSKSEPGLSLDDALSELETLIDDAVEFKSTDLEPNWATAERYYAGGTDLEEFEGRSVVTKTEVRDAIRNTMPSIMRVLLSTRNIVQYIPTSVQHGMWVEQQAQYVNSLFFKNGGYMHLYNACMEALKLKNGVLKAAWDPSTRTEYVSYTKVPFEMVEQLSADPLIEVLDFEEHESSLPGTELQPNEVDFYDVNVLRHKENGQIYIENTPNYEFFISKNCDTIEQAILRGVHGQQTIITVSEAIDMGLDYDGDWLELDAEDPELSDHASSSLERRKTVKDEPNNLSSVDVLRHKFLLTEVYVSFDLENEGQTQLWRFLLGGTSYEYLDRQRVQDSPYAIVKPIPVPHSPYGDSIADLTVNEQDASTSLLRAAIDNAHAANDARFVADPTKTEFDDIMNPAINAPIRSRHGAQVQTIQIPFTAQGTLGVLQYLDQDIQNKVGVTKAAQGLDPDSMQSTDKNAVLNTIATSQGQTELMVRNIIESGLVRLFRILLRLSIQHQSPIQMMSVKGNVIPVNTSMFDPDAAAVPNVGLGTAGSMQRQALLASIVQRIEQYMDKFGPNNPFTSYSQLYNALEDLYEAGGIYNMERYFNIITPGVEKQWAAEQEKRQQALMEQQQQNQPMDPSKAFLQVEEGKRKVDHLKIVAETRANERKLELDALKAAENADLERDRLIQERTIKIAESVERENINEAKLIREQKSNDNAISTRRKARGSENGPKSGVSDAGGVSSGKSENGGA